ncbi:MAG: SDR family oxidoreductase [Acidobacteria bacterium]|nr:SDR family oxidoreductase [Acidobacteriota bacterium]
MGVEIFSLEGKTALVTGASRGIGAAIALAYAECGADLALAARSTGDLEALAGKIAAAGRNAVPVTCDVTDPASVRACVDSAVAGLGWIDVLVNNAGGNRFMTPVVGTRDEGWAKNIRLNLDSVFWFCKSAGAHMVERGSGSVINISSVGGLRGSPALASYGAAKAAVVNLTRSLALEWGHAGVRANALCPGWVRTELNRNLWDNPEASAALIGAQPIKRWGETSDVVGAAIWLASDAAAYVTGATILVDGGQTA